MIKRLLLAALAILACSSAAAQTYLGDFLLGQTIEFRFPAYNSSAASVTLSSLALGDILVYKDHSDTERSSTSGFTLKGTSGADIDGKTGFHGFYIDTSDNTDANFYAPGHEYEVYVYPFTVDSQTVGYVFQFSIENRALSKDRIKARGNMVTGSSTTLIQLPTGTLAGTHAWQGLSIHNVARNEDATICDSADGGAGNDTLTVAGFFTTPGSTDAYEIVRTGMPSSCIPIPPNGGFPAINATTGAVRVEALGTSSFTTITDKSASNWVGNWDNLGATFSGTQGVLYTAATGTYANLGTPLNSASGATIAANLADYHGAAHVGTCDSMSSTTTCNNASLTEADNFWSGWTAIIVAGEPPRCVRAFANSTHRLTFSPALPLTAASKLFVLRAEPSCRTVP